MGKERRGKGEVGAERRWYTREKAEMEEKRGKGRDTEERKSSKKRRRWTDNREKKKQN